MRKLETLSALVIAFIPLTALVAAGHNVWPAVRSLTRRFAFRNGASAALSVDIRGSSGIPEYKLECHTGGYSDPDFAYSGAFDCRLSALNLQGGYSTLLTENPYQSSDVTRARFLPEEIFGQRNPVPGYGRVRNFHVRGMSITLSVLDARRDDQHPEYFKSFDFEVSVAPDPSALSGIAAPVPLPAPATKGKRGFGTNGQRSLSTWPAVLPAASQMLFRGGASHTVQLSDSGQWANSRQKVSPHLLMPVRDRQGRVVYHVECGEFSPTLGTWGIACRMGMPGLFRNLLSPATDPYSLVNQAFFLPRQLRPDGKEDPVWGARRTFRFRGMMLRINADDPTFADAAAPNPALLRSVRVSCSVVPDPAATGASPPVPSSPYLTMFR